MLIVEGVRGAGNALPTLHKRVVDLDDTSVGHLELSQTLDSLIERTLILFRQLA